MMRIIVLNVKMALILLLIALLILLITVDLAI